jgi:hypothetical protein
MDIEGCAREFGLSGTVGCDDEEVAAAVVVVG